MAASVKVKLTEPVQFGKDELIEELELKPLSRHFREFSLPMTGDGKIDYQPYKLAQVGVQMAGKPSMFVDKLSVIDMVAVAQEVLGFFVPSQPTGPTPSES